MDPNPIGENYTLPASELTSEAQAYKLALKCGYSKDDLTLIPPGTLSELGCGNAIGAADLKEGELVLEFGCGAKVDIFLAAAKVGSNGKAVGVDDSEELVKSVISIAKCHKKENIEFYRSSIEQLPFADGTFNVAICNCVLNLVPDKLKVFAQIYRVLKHGSGRFIISAILIKKPVLEEAEAELLSEVIDLENVVDSQTYKHGLEAVGFQDVVILDKKLDLECLYTDHKGKKRFCGGKKKQGKIDVEALKKCNLNEYVMSCTIKAYKKD